MSILVGRACSSNQMSWSSWLAPCSYDEEAISDQKAAGVSGKQSEVLEGLGDCDRESGAWASWGEPRGASTLVPGESA